MKSWIGVGLLVTLLAGPITFYAATRSLRAVPVYECVKGHSSKHHNAPVFVGSKHYCGKCFAEWVDENVNEALHVPAGREHLEISDFPPNKQRLRRK